MKRLLCLSGLLMLVATALAQPQPPVKKITQATPPPREVLDKLSLTLAWRNKLPTDGARDGLATIQLAPGVFGSSDILFVQTFAGIIYAINAETGDLLWRTSVGLPYQPLQPLGFNSTTVFAVRREMLYILDRATGAQLVYQLHRETREPIFGMKLEEVPSTALIADERFVYVCMDHRVSAYLVPDFRKLGEYREREAKAKGIKIRPFTENSPQPERDWSRVLVQLQVDLPPRLTPDFLALACNDGTFLTLLSGKDGGQEAYRYKTFGPIRAAMGQHENSMYVGSEDFNLYSFDAARAQLQWRFPGSSPIMTAVEVTDRDVYVVPERLGLTRVDRFSGKAIWVNKTARRFLCTNYKYVYASDAFGNLLVLDYLRGTEMARWDASKWVIPLSNDRTDRLFLANHDGQVVCLHHRDFVKPLVVRTDKVVIKKEEEIKPKKKKEKPKEENMENPGQQSWLSPEPYNLRVVPMSPIGPISPISPIRWRHELVFHFLDRGIFDRRTAEGAR